MSENFAAFAYLVSGVLFIMALRGLSHPTTSRQGNLTRTNHHPRPSHPFRRISVTMT